MNYNVANDDNIPSVFYDVFPFNSNEISKCGKFNRVT